jgi:hypothetical protein
MAAIAVVVIGGGSGIEPTVPMAESLTVAVVAGATMASLPTPLMTTTSILALIALALALALPWTRIRRRGGGCTVMHLICCCHGPCHWCHLCLHSQDDCTKEVGSSNRQGRNANIHCREEVGHNNPISMEVTKGQPVQRGNQPAC